MEHYICENCDNTFKDPICEECQLRELEVWLTEEGYSRINTRVILTAIRKEFDLLSDSLHNEDETRCAVCNKTHVLACPYCLHEIVLKKLEKFHANKKVILDFLKIFNYALDSHHLRISHKR